MIRHQGRTYYLGGHRVLAYDDDHRDTPLPPSVLAHREECAALKALVAVDNGRFYAWGQQDATGTADIDAAIAFGEEYGLHVFKFELEESSYQYNVRTFYEKWQDIKRKHAKARELGAEAGKAGASWVFNGDTDVAHYARCIELDEVGDPLWDHYYGPQSGHCPASGLIPQRSKVSCKSWSCLSGTVLSARS